MEENRQNKVLVVMGSDSDFPLLKSLFQTLAEFEISYEAKVCSAHRTPDLASKLAKEARGQGFGAIIAAAGMAAHLAGVMAAYTTLPIIAIPIASGSFQGVDALLASVQMPPGVPVATVAVNGAKNAAILAAQIFSLFDGQMASRLSQYKESMQKSVEQKGEKLKNLLADLKISQ